MIEQFQSNNTCLNTKYVDNGICMKKLRSIVLHYYIQDNQHILLKIQLKSNILNLLLSCKYQFSLHAKQYQSAVNI